MELLVRIAKFLVKKNIFLFITGFLFVPLQIFAAGGQVLDSSFFPNSAELTTVNHFEFVGGNIFFVPQFTFKGTSHGQDGTAHARVYDPVAYVYSKYRITDKFVVSAHLIPSLYADVSLPANSIVAHTSILTDVLNYRGGIQVGYQATPDLSLGVGGNIERISLQLSFLTNNLGQQIDKNASYFPLYDLGLYYKLAPKTYMSLVYYSPVYGLGHGVSKAHNVINHNYVALNVDASVIYIGLKHNINDWWQIHGKVYFAKWDVAKNFLFYNTVSGDIIKPAYWRNVWTFLVNNQYTLSDKTLLDVEFSYETTPVSRVEYNYVGFPISAIINFNVAMSYKVYENTYVQLKYSHSSFAPNTLVRYDGTHGTVSANMNAAVLQGAYK